MGLLEKLKNTFFEEEYVEVEEEEPKKVKKESKKELKREEIQVARKVNEVEKIEEKNEKLEISQETARENVEEPEMENAQYVKNLNILRNVQKYSDFMRSIYTEELEKVFRNVQEKLNDREELKRKQWEEER